MKPADFVHIGDIIPDAIPEIRYYSDFNFVGKRIDGYEKPAALLTLKAALALKKAADDFALQGYRIKVFDAYRPVRAVAHFLRWVKDADDTRMKPFFYPDIDKSELLVRGYIAENSGHSRGSTLDLTLCDRSTGKDLDMGSSFDWFGIESHSDCCGDPETGEYTGRFEDNTQPERGSINAGQFRRRMMLRSVMLRHGFRPVMEEWWHFTLADEPYPDTCFDYPVR